jgi:hypothetical protein
MLIPLSSLILSILLSVLFLYYRFPRFTNYLIVDFFVYILSNYFVVFGLFILLKIFLKIALASLFLGFPILYFLDNSLLVNSSLYTVVTLFLFVFSSILGFRHKYARNKFPESILYFIITFIPFFFFTSYYIYQIYFFKFLNDTEKIELYVSYKKFLGQNITKVNSVQVDGSKIKIEKLFSVVDNNYYNHYNYNGETITAYEDEPVKIEFVNECLKKNGLSTCIEVDLKIPDGNNKYTMRIQKWTDSYTRTTTELKLNLLENNDKNIKLASDDNKSFLTVGSTYLCHDGIMYDRVGKIEFINEGVMYEDSRECFSGDDILNKKNKFKINPFLFPFFQIKSSSF